MTRASAAIVFGLLSGMMATAARAQIPPPTTIRGRVVADDTGDPIRNARVGTAEGSDAVAALTDAEGRFTLTPVPADQRELFAAKTGYVRSATPVSADLDIRLIRGGVITGRVLDDLGDPMPLINVVAFRVRRAGASLTFERFRGAETNDLGDYRLFGLPAGEFVVAAVPGRVGTATATIPIDLDRVAFRNYYPHVEKPEQAQIIRVAPGEETPGIDFVTTLPPFADLQRQAAQSAGQPASRSGAIIRGRIVGPEGLPIRRARVQLISTERLFTPYFTPTDDDGRYEFGGLKPGGYLVTAGTLSGNLTPFSASSGSRRPEPITLEAGAVRDDVNVTLPRGGVISGRILDEYGDPMANANVRVEIVTMVRGRRRLTPVPGIASGQTNDLGRYRIFGLPPGHYLLGAVVGEEVPGWQTAAWPGYARTYFSGTPVPGEAQTVDLDAGQQALTVDISLLRGRIARVTGTVHQVDGAPLQGVVSLTQSARSGAVTTPPVSVRTDEDGRFAFVRVAPGEYVLQAVGSRPTVSTEGEFASMFLTVDGTDVAGIALSLSSGSTIEGRLTFDGADPPEDPDFRISPVPTDPDLASLVDNEPARADIHDDLTFEMSGVTGPRRIQLTQAPDGWALKAVQANGIDVTDTVMMFGTPDQSLQDVEVVLTKRVSELTVVAGATGSGGAADFRVFAFPTDRAKRYPGSRHMTTAAPERGGAAVVKGLPPGDYYVVALGRGAIPDTPTDPVELMESLAADAMKVTLTEGEHRSISVKVKDR